MIIISEIVGVVVGARIKIDKWATLFDNDVHGMDVIIVRRHEPTRFEIIELVGTILVCSIVAQVRCV